MISTMTWFVHVDSGWWKISKNEIVHELNSNAKSIENDLWVTRSIDAPKVVQVHTKKKNFRTQFVIQGLIDWRSWWIGLTVGTGWMCDAADEPFNKQNEKKRWMIDREWSESWWLNFHEWRKMFKLTFQK